MEVKRQKKSKINWDKYAPYLYVAPFFILFIVFSLFPLIFSGYLAFSKWDGLGQIQFTGLRNFQRLLRDKNFYLSLYNTFIIWFIGTVPMLFMALVLAFLLNQKFVKHKKLFRNLYFLPNITAVVAIGILFSLIFSNSDGLMNGILTSLGFEPINWMTTPKWVRVVIASINIWQYTGYNMIIYLTGLTNIPTELYETARIDGANNWQIFTNVTIPHLRPIILFTVINSTIGGLQIFTEAQVLVPTNATAEGGALTVAYYIYELAFTQNQYGYGSTVSWVFAIIIVIISVINNKVTQSNIEGEE